MEELTIAQLKLRVNLLFIALENIKYGTPEYPIAYSMFWDALKELTEAENAQREY